MWKVKGKKVLVVGLGRSGVAAVRFLLKEGARVAATDTRRESELSAALVRIGARLDRVAWGGNPPEIFQGHDLIVVSPGVPPDLEGLKSARRRRIPIVGEFGLAAEQIRTPLISVTGTNGKSTTSTLLARILSESGRKTALAGNIGKPLLEVVMESKRYDWIVAETSSFQLESVRHFHPRVSLLLNITPDHLDRYRSLSDYARSKFRIFREQGPRDLLLYNADDPVILRGLKGGRRCRARRLGFSSRREQDQGLFLAGDEIVYRPRRAGPEERYSLAETPLIGLHNAENMMAAIGAARFCGVRPDSIRRSLRRFKGLPHRMEMVRELRGVRYYNDSKGTNVDAVAKSLAGLPDGRVLLIAGGYDKGGSYQPLCRLLQKKVKQLLLIGAATTKIRRAVEGCAETLAAGDLSRAVPLAAARAAPGDIVLLSPACASYDQFKNFEERGDLFKKLVNAL